MKCNLLWPRRSFVNEPIAPHMLTLCKARPNDVRRRDDGTYDVTYRFLYGRRLVWIVSAVPEHADCV